MTEEELIAYRAAWAGYFSAFMELGYLSEELLRYTDEEHGCLFFAIIAYRNKPAFNKIWPALLSYPRSDLLVGLIETTLREVTARGIVDDDIRDLRNVTSAYICKLLSAYIRYSGYSSSFHRVDQHFKEERDWIKAFMYLCERHYRQRRGPREDVVGELWLINDFLQKVNDRSELIKLRERYERLHHTYFGAEVSDDSDDDAEERKSYPRDLTDLPFMKAAAAGRVRNYSALSLLDDGAVEIGPPTRGRVSKYQLRTSEELTMWLLRSQLARLKRCLSGARLTLFQVNSKTLNTLYRDFHQWILNLYVTPEDRANIVVVNAALQAGRRMPRTRRPFIVPLFRGVGYFGDRWAPGAYRAHYRDEHELAVSEAALRTADVDPFHSYEQLVAVRAARGETFTGEIRKNSRKLKLLLLALRNTNPILAEINGKPVLFDNLLLFLQQVYSNGIERFLRLVHQLRELYPQIAWDELIPNASNLFLSFGELPEHTLRYGYGDKNPYSEFRPRPRYRASGKPEHPHVGKCLTGFFHMLTFTTPDRPNVIRQLRAMKQVKMDMLVGPEMEVSFLAHVPADCLLPHTHLRYPNFSYPEYPEHYLAKYGIDRKLYMLFRRCYVGRTRQPHDVLEETVDESLYNWLKLFYGFNMLTTCYQEAHRQGACVVYLTDDPHTFSVDLPAYSTDLQAADDANPQQIAREVNAQTARLGLCFSRFDGVYSYPMLFTEVTPQQICEVVGHERVNRFLRTAGKEPLLPPDSPAAERARQAAFRSSIRELRRLVFGGYSSPSISGGDANELGLSTLFGGLDLGDDEEEGRGASEARAEGDQGGDAHGVEDVIALRRAAVRGLLQLCLEGERGYRVEHQADDDTWLIRGPDRTEGQLRVNPAEGQIQFFYRDGYYDLPEVGAYLPLFDGEAAPDMRRGPV